MRIIDVELAYDGEECGYRIVELSDGQHAFVWGNIRSRVGDLLPQDEIDSPKGDRGISLHPGFGDAVMAWEDCADALTACGAYETAGHMRLLSDDLSRWPRPPVTCVSCLMTYPGGETRSISGVDVPRIEDGLEGIIRWAWGVHRLSSGLPYEPTEIVIEYGTVVPIVVRLLQADAQAKADAFAAEQDARNADLPTELEDECSDH